MLASYAANIVIVRVDQLWPHEARFEGTVIGSIRGEIEEGQWISMIYPGPDPEERWLFDRKPLEVGSCVLAYLREKRGKDWWPVGARGETRQPGDEQWRRKALSVWGGQGSMHIACEEAAEVSRLFGRFMEWDGMELEERSDLIGEALMSDSRSMRWIALDWITLDSKVDFDEREEVTDPIVEGIVFCATDPDPKIKLKAVFAIKMAATTRKDLIPYLVDALDDPDIAGGALGGLQMRVRPVAAGPVIDASADKEAKIQAWKEWWQETGRHNPEFKRFVPSVTEGTEPPLECPGD